MSILLSAGTAGAVLFVLVFLVDGATRPGYDPVRHAVSALALGPRGWVQAANFIVCGLLIAVAAVGVFQAVGNVWFAVLVGVFGLALAGSGVFPMDPMRGYPPGAPEGTPSETTARHRWHDRLGAVVFVSLPAAAVAAALVLDTWPWAVYSGAVAAAMVVLLFVFGSAWDRDSPRAGLVQRVMIVLGWSWLALVCLHLMP